MSGIAPFKFWLIVLGTAGVAAYSFWFGFKAWRKERIVQDTPTSKVRSAAQGYVELTGFAVALPDSQTRGPLTGLPCAWWRYKVEGRSRGGRSRSWTTVQSDTSAAPIMLDDGTGQCLIDPRGAEVYPGANSVWYGPSSWPEIYIPKGSGIFDWLVDTFIVDRYRYTEHRLMLREPLYAIGALRNVGGISVESPDAAVAQLLRDWKADQGRLLARFDLDHDGILSSAEWQRARASARDEVQSARAAEPAKPRLSVLANPTDNRAFLLAASDEETLARRLRHRAVAGIAVFLTAVAALARMWTDL